MKWRRRLLVGAIVTAIAAAAIAGWLIARTSSPPSGPVILISIEGLRPDRLGAYGSRRGLAPNIDALAADSVVFDRAYSHSPLTVPAHVSILSGTLPLDTGARADQGYVLPEKLRLLPSLLHRRGFKTAGIVSSALLGRETGLAAAFDFFDDDLAPRAPSTPAASVRRDGGETLAVAQHWVEQQGTRFFLFLHLDETRDAPGVTPADAADAAVRRADAIVGRFVQFLKDRELYGRAVIVLLSDHGEALGEHGEVGHGVFLYDETMRTPLIVKMPEQEGGGRRRTEVVQQVDVAPTVLDLMGAPRPSGVRGRSLQDLLTSQTATLEPGVVYAETYHPQLQFGWAPLASVTEGRYRLVRAPRTELYDLMQDRGERQNIAESNPEKVAALSLELDKFKPPAEQHGAAPALADEDREALLALVSETPLPSTPPRQGKALPASPGVASTPAPQPSARSGAAASVEARAAANLEEAVVPVDPKDRLAVLETLRTAQALTQEGRLPEAIAAYRRVQSVDPGVVAAWRECGSLLLAIGQGREALDAFRHLLQIRPEDADGVLGAARALARLGKLDEAARVAAFGARLDPIAGNELLVRIDLSRKDYPGARMAADAAKQVDPASPLPALVEGVELSLTGKYEEAVPHLDEAVQLADAQRVQMMDVRFYAGDALAHLRRYSEAESRLSQEIKWFPENVRARELLALVYQATGRAADVPALVQDLVRSSPTPEGYAAAVRVSASAGDKDGAASLRARARQLFGETAARAAEAPTR